jgi:hypothetical protein
MSVYVQVVARYAVIMLTLYLINFIILGRGFRFRSPIAIQRIHAKKSSVKLPNTHRALHSPITIAFSRHSNCLPSSLRGFQELPQLLLEDLQPLCTGCVRHS